MAVEVSTEKTAIELSWDPGEYEGEVVLELTGEAGDVHQSVRMPNDGAGVVTYPAGFSGETQVRVVDADNQDNVVDEGSISV